MTSLPSEITNEQQLDDLLTTPSPQLVEVMSRLRGNLLVLGAGGKMGPTLAVRAQRAAEQAGSQVRIIAVSRFSDESSRRWLTDRGVQTESADLLDRQSLSQLPEADQVIYLVGTKFGTKQNPSQTWAINTLVPSYVMERYPQAKFVALSTGNVYPLTPVSSGGPTEADPVGPIGEYANAAVGRERIVEYCSRRHSTPVVIMRLNYAVDLRYGVLTDIATRIAADEPVDLANGYLNCIWQGDANDAILRALEFAESPPLVLNLTGSDILSVRKIAEQLGQKLNRPVTFTGEEAESALLNNASKYHQLLGPPSVSSDQLIDWTAGWIRSNGRLLNKPTHFEVRDGAF